MASKPPNESKTVMTQVVLPNDTNTLGNLRGGKLLHWMDLSSAISAQKHSGRIVVTAAVDNVSFENPIKLGEVVTIHSKVTRAFKTSMEVRIRVWTENIPEQKKIKTNEAYYTFVAIDQNNAPIEVPQVDPQTEEEQKMYEGASRRRELRLVLSGKIEPDEAQELKALFLDNIRDDLL